jgi:hypothetical protein
VSLFKGEASLGDGDSGEARFTDPEGQTVALPAGTLFPTAIARETIRQAKAGEGGFDALFFYGEKVKPPQSVNIVIGKVPRRLADVKVPDGAEALADGRSLIYYRAGFFDAGRLWADFHPHPELDGTAFGLKYGTGGGIRLQQGKTFVVRLDVLPHPVLDV